MARPLAWPRLRLAGMKYLLDSKHRIRAGAIELGVGLRQVEIGMGEAALLTTSAVRRARRAGRATPRARQRRDRLVVSWLDQSTSEVPTLMPVYPRL